MPLVEFNKAYYDTCYQFCEQGYTRAEKFRVLHNIDHIVFKNALQLQPGDSILIIGAGFGWQAEEWINMGLGPICAVDTAQWIQDNKATESVIPIYDFDITTQAGKDQAKSILGITGNNKIKWAITEDMIVCLSDAECLLLASSLREIAETVVHYTTVPTNFNTVIPHNWKSIADWKTFLSPDLIVQNDGICNVT